MTRHNIHRHNGRDTCADFENCTKCHCHFQDENHVSCCKGDVAREIYEARQERIDRYTCGGAPGCDGCRR